MRGDIVEAYAAWFMVRVFAVATAIFLVGASVGHWLF